jgi:4-oxalocrotonate tautomerase
MPVITVQLAGARPAETKRRLASALTDAVVDVLDVPRSDITVLIEEFARENWATGGSLASDRSAKDNPEAARLDLEAFFRKPAAKVIAKPKKAAAKSPRRR